MIGCCCGEGNSKIYQSFILRRNNLFYHFLRPGQGQAIRKRMVLPAKLLPAARKSKNISLSNLVIFSTIQILTSPRQPFCRFATFPLIGESPRRLATSPTYQFRIRATIFSKQTNFSTRFARRGTRLNYSLT